MKFDPFTLFHLSLPVFLFHLSPLSFSLSLFPIGCQCPLTSNVTWSSNIGFFFFTFYSIRVIESLILSTCPKIFVSFRIFFSLYFLNSSTVNENWHLENVRKLSDDKIVISNVTKKDGGEKKKKMDSLKINWHRTDRYSKSEGWGGAITYEKKSVDFIYSSRNGFLCLVWPAEDLINNQSVTKVNCTCCWWARGGGQGKEMKPMLINVYQLVTIGLAAIIWFLNDEIF